MKKTILTTIMVMTAVFSINAQAYLGGSVGYSKSTAKDEIYSQTQKEKIFSFSPEIGYSINPKMDIGIHVSFNRISQTIEYYDQETKQNSWFLAPYFRYNVVQFGKFGVLLKAAVGFGGGKDKIENAYTDVEKELSNWSIGVLPVLKFSLSDHFSLFANLNFCSLGYAESKIKDEKTNSYFGFLVNTDDLVNIGGETGLTIGFAYSF